MEERKRILAVAGGGAALAALLGLGLYFQHRSIEKTRTEIATSRKELEEHNALLTKTSQLEQDVIVHRETDEVVKTILPNDQDVLNFVRTLRTFEENSGIRISSIKDKTQSKTKDKKDKSEFERVAYTINYDCDAFQLLGFMDSIESHERFMRVPNFKMKAAERKDQSADQAEARHQVDMEVETYVYRPNSEALVVKIEGYDAKRDLLRTRIATRQRDLTVQNYEYQGARNRRDPWIDPRVPAQQSFGPGMSIEQQIDIVEKLIERTHAANSLLVIWQAADNLIAEMKARGELETVLAGLEEDVRRVESEGQLLFLPAERRFQQEVVDALDSIRQALVSDEGVQLPVVMLRQAVDTMYNHLERGEYELALEAYRGLEGRLDLVELDPLRQPLVQRLREYARLSETVIEFNKLDLLISGIADLGPDRRVVLIGGQPFAPGEIISADLMIKEIFSDEICFIYKDVELTRPLIP